MEHFLVMGYRGCSSGWGRSFTTGLTIMGSPFQDSKIKKIIYPKVTKMGSTIGQKVDQKCTIMPK